MRQENEASFGSEQREERESVRREREVCRKMCHYYQKLCQDMLVKAYSEKGRVNV